MHNRSPVVFFISIVFILSSLLITPPVAAQILWSKMDRGTSKVTMRGISGRSATDVFAVGDGGAVFHFDGDGNNDGITDNMWEQMLSPTDNKLNAVWGGSDSGVFAVGDSGTILFGYKGIHFSIMNDKEINANLYAVWGSPEGSVFAAGYDASRSKGVILYYDGDGNNDGNPDNIWESIESGTSNPLRGIWGSSNDDIFFVGDDSTILRYKNGKISSIPKTNKTPQVNLYGIWGTPKGSVFAVGHDTKNTKNPGVILSFDLSFKIDGKIGIDKKSGSPNFNSQTTSRPLRGIWGISPNAIIAVGDGGTVLQYTNNEWANLKSEKPIPETENLNGVWVSQNPHVFVVGGFSWYGQYTGQYSFSGNVFDIRDSSGIGSATIQYKKNGCSTCQWSQPVTTTGGAYGSINTYPDPVVDIKFNHVSYNQIIQTVELLYNCNITNYTYMVPSTSSCHTIAGVVSEICQASDCGVTSYYYCPIENVTVKIYKYDGCDLPPNPQYTPMTDQRGHYYKQNLLSGNYKVAPEKQGYTFTPQVITLPSSPYETHVCDFVPAP